MIVHKVTIFIIMLSNLPAWSRRKSKASLNRHPRPCLLSGYQLQRRYAVFRRNYMPGVQEVLPDKSMLPPRSENYDPNWGYEPYWADGNWVWKPLKPKKGDMCGTRCNPMYKTYGKICGRDKNYKHKTFKDYCAMRNEDCEGGKGWRIAYRGGCQGGPRTYPTKSLQIVTRVPTWLANFSKRYPKYKKG